MKLITFIFIALLWSTDNIVYGQYYEVLTARKVYRANGDKIRKGQRVDRTDIVLVKAKGELYLRSITYVNPRLLPGRYNIDSLMTADYVRHATHDSVKNVLRAKKLLGCKFRYKVMMVPGTNRPYYADRIKVFNDPVMTIREGDEPAKVRWVNPDKHYKRNYVVVVQDAATKSFIDIIETDEREILIDFPSYRYPLQQYFIKAEDCRGSETYGVKIIP